MKKLLLSAGVALLLTSCYNDKITVGTVDRDEPLVHVASSRNFHLLGGLMVSHDKVKNHVPGVENYVIASKQTFGDLFVTGLTLGIYSPTTTKYYVPKSNPKVVAGKKKFASKAYKGYLKD